MVWRGWHPRRYRGGTVGGTDATPFRFFGGGGNGGRYVSSISFPWRSYSRVRGRRTATDCLSERHSDKLLCGDPHLDHDSRRFLRVVDKRLSDDEAVSVRLALHGVGR